MRQSKKRNGKFNQISSIGNLPVSKNSFNFQPAFISCPPFMKYFFCVCLLCLMTTRATDNLVAQPSSPFFDNAWQYWGPEDGLPQSFVYTIIEDQYGRIWIGTQAGVSMFDGKNFHTWGKLQGLSSGDVRALCIDTSGNQMWIAMSDKTLYVMNMANFHIRKLDFNNLDCSIRALLPFEKGVIAATNGGVFYIPSMQNPPYSAQPVSMYPAKDKEVMSLTLGNSNQFYVGYKSGGLWRKIGGNHLNPECFWEMLKKGNKEDSIVNALYYRNSRLSAICGNDIFQWSGGIISAVPKNWENEELTTLMEDNLGRLWIGTMGSGILIFNPSEQAPPNPIVTNQLNNKQIHSIFQDSKGVVWVGTKDGLYAFSNRKQHFFTPELYQSISANVYALARDPQFSQYLWMGTWEQGFQRSDLSNPTLPATLVKPEEAIFLNKDRRAPCIAVIGNEVWVGTAKGIFRIRNRNGKEPWVAGIPDIGDNTINARAMFFSKADGALWVIARKESSDLLLRFPIKENGEPAELPETFRPNIGGLRTLSEIATDSALWLGTEQGLFRVPNGVKPDADFFRKNQPLVKGYILSFHVSKTGANKLWIGRKSEGLLSFSLDNSLNNGRIVRKWDTSNSAIPDNSVYSIAEDKYGRLWLGTNHGLVRFNPENNFFVAYGKVDYLPHEYNINGFTEVGDTMWFGGVGGVAGFIPLEPKKDSIATFLYLVDSSGWLPVFSGTRHWFSPDDGLFKFVSVSPDYTDPSRSAHRFTLVEITLLGLGKPDTIEVFYGHKYGLPTSLHMFGFYRLYVEQPEGKWGGDNADYFHVKFVMLPSIIETNFGLLLLLSLVGLAWWWWQASKNRQLREMSETIALISARTRDAQTEDDLRKALLDAFVGGDNILKSKLNADVFAISMVNEEGTYLVDWFAVENGKPLKGGDYSLSERERPAVRCFQEKVAIFDNNFHRKERLRPKAGESMNSVIYVPIINKNGESIGVATMQAQTKKAFKRREHIYFLRWLTEVLTQQKFIENARLLVKNDQLRFSVLSSQMNPHFLSNMFKVLANEKAEPERQRAFARRMAFVARSWLYATEEEKEGAISLKDDWEILTEYVNALKTRYNLEDLSWTQQVDLPPSMHTRDIKIPVLFIQPYVENSIEHGLSYRFDKIMGKGAVLGLRTFLENEYLCIELKDNGGGITKEVEAWLNTDNPIQQPEGKHKSKSVLINRERVRIINRLNPDFKSAEKCDAIKVNGPKNYFSADNPETPCGVVVTVCLRIDLVLKGYLGK